MSKEVTQEKEASVEVTEPKTIQAGESGISFEEFDAIESYKDRERELKAEEEVEVEKKKEELRSGDKEEEGKAGKKEVESKKEDDEEEDDEPAKAAKDKEEEVEEEPKEVKVYKSSNGDDELELRGDSKHTVKVDGKKVEVTYEDLLSSYSGKQAVEKRFGELGAKKKQYLDELRKYQEDKSYFDKRIGYALDLLKSDPMVGLAELAEMSGSKGEEFLKVFNKKFTEDYDAFLNLSDEERAAREREVLTNWKEQKLKMKENDLTQAEQYKAVAREVEQIKSEYNIDDETFQETFIELESMQKAGKLQGEITAEFVKNVVMQDRLETRVKSVLEVVRPSLMDDSEKFYDLVNLLYSQDPKAQLGEDDIKDIVIQAYPESNPDSDLSKKVSKAKEATKKDASPKSPQNEPLTFDDLQF